MNIIRITYKVLIGKSSFLCVHFCEFRIYIQMTSHNSFLSKFIRIFQSSFICWFQSSYSKPWTWTLDSTEDWSTCDRLLSFSVHEWFNISFVWNFECWFWNANQYFKSSIQLHYYVKLQCWSFVRFRAWSHSEVVNDKVKVTLIWSER